MQHNKNLVLIPAQIPVVCYGDNEAINILPRAVADAASAGSFDANVGNELISR